MPALSVEQIRALTELRARSNELIAAEWEYNEAEGLCCSMSISARQIATMGRTSASMVLRRQRQRVEQMREEVAS